MKENFKFNRWTHEGRSARVIRSGWVSSFYEFGANYLHGFAVSHCRTSSEPIQSTSLPLDCWKLHKISFPVLQ